MDASDAGGRLDLAIARLLGTSRTRAATLIATGGVHVNAGRERASYLVRPGDRLVADVPAEAARTVEPEAIPLTVVYEDASLVVIDKPAGMVVHPAPGHWTGTLVHALAGRVVPPADAAAPPQAGVDAEGEPARAGIVHRLDKDTSGLLLVAKTERAHRLLTSAIAARRVRRRYAALVWGHIGGDRLTVEAPIGRDPRDRKRMAIVAAGRAARTDVVRLARFDAVELLQAQLHTGRTHQIRVHLASIGHPVVGDASYGGGDARRMAGIPATRHFLHAAWLTFAHPLTGATMDLRSPLPADLAASLVAVAGPELHEIGPRPEGGTEMAEETDILTRLGFYAL